MIEENEVIDLSEQLKKQMDDIIDVAYKGEDPQLVRKFHRFSVHCSEQDSKRINGNCRWIPEEQASQIRVLKLEDRSYKGILITTIHEVAHHIDMVKTGSMGHGTSFYDEHMKLLYAALDMSILSKEDVMEYKDSRSANKIAKRTDKEYEANPVDYKKDVVQVRVYNAMYVKEILKARRFRWNNADKAWVLETKRQYLNYTLKKLRELAQFGLDPKDIKVIDSPAVISRLVRHVTLKWVPVKKNAEIKALGYRWKANHWCKDIEGDDIPPEEHEALKAIDGHIQVEIS